MSKFKLTPQLIEGIIERVPEGYIHRSTLKKRFKVSNNAALMNHLPPTSRVGLTGSIFYDRTRLSEQQVQDVGKWFHPPFPAMSKEGVLLGPPVEERIAARNAQLAAEGRQEALDILQQMEATQGCALLVELTPDTETQTLIEQLIAERLLRQQGGFVYDPLRISDSTMGEVRQHHELAALREEVIEYLQAKPGQTAPQDELAQKYGAERFKDLLSLGGFSQFSVDMKVAPFRSHWVRLKGSDASAAHRIAVEAVKIKDEAWEDALEAAGEVMRPGAREGTTRRSRVIAHSYTVSNAAKRLNIRPVTLERAINAGHIMTFVDPEGRTRLPARDVEAALSDVDYGEEIAGYETLQARDLALVSGLSYTTIRRRLKRGNISTSEPQWRQVRGKWNLPDTLWEFYETLRIKKEELRAIRDAQLAEERRLLEELREQERQRRAELRARLVAAFPTWQHENRAEQRVILHVGPPNSGKTYEALRALTSAGSGWYLAPLRLLAFEVFDRLNRDGILCNLLTGEEYIPVPGAQFTAATIEMFNRINSGECVIIDEAQMLADPDRGWAWTRALMEAEAPEIHVIGPPTARDLIKKMANAAAMPMTVIEHQRLAPIQVAERHWPLQELEPRTILVAFSRQMVLELKITLERMKRSVSVVYGSLPPEVRRRQADRFADGETEICIATDAVGMGLNLPADYVCFYEIEKFDGRTVRELTASEVQQIGGRAGRYGLSKAGEVGAINKRDLNRIRKLYYDEPEQLTHARVAPSVEDLEMIPGSLSEKLVQWSSLGSIPESLRGAIKTADMSERIELARMLTDAEVDQLGMETALKLINAPTRQSSRQYWYDCAQKILAAQPMPQPPQPPKRILNSVDLETIETCVTCADIYLWLSRRREFSAFAPDEPEIRIMRAEWSALIDLALMQNIVMSRRCSRCRAPLPVHHPYGLCHNCYIERFQRYSDM